MYLSFLSPSTHNEKNNLLAQPLELKTKPRLLPVGLICVVRPAWA
jgi:hypothetical protein